MGGLRWTTSEAKERLYQGLAECTGWKFIKSKPCLRQRMDDIVLELVFYSSKYNNLEDTVEMNCEFRIWCKAYDKVCNINSKIAYCLIRPDDGYWYDIASMSNLERAREDIKQKIGQYVMPAAEAFEKGREAGLSYIGSAKTRDIYHVDSFRAYARMAEEIGRR